MEKMRYVPIISGLIILILLLAPLASNSTSSPTKQVYKQIALYPSLVPAIKALEHSISYNWTIDNIHYVLNVSMISQWQAKGKGPRSLDIDNYDVFVIGASARQYIHGINSEWKKNVQKFVSEGGGYVGICGGANEASLGAVNPSTVIDKIISKGALGIVNVYINDDQDEEWQYLYKSSGVNSGVPVSCLLSDHPILAVSPVNPRAIRYEGGPGMYPGDGNNSLFGGLVCLAIYAEEPSIRAPLHHWVEDQGEWVIESPIYTDIEDQYAAVATTYGIGRIVLFGPHPEEYTIVGGHVEEFLGRMKYTLFRDDYLYRWVDGTQESWTYNWWMVRRSIAWVAGIPDNHLPPLDSS